MIDKQLLAKELGARVAAARSNRTQAAVAKLAAMAPNTWARIERGEMVPRADALRRIALALGVSADWLLQIS